VIQIIEPIIRDFITTIEEIMKEKTQIDFLLSKAQIKILQRAECLKTFLQIFEPVICNIVHAIDKEDFF